jgi:hypothetical protein
MRLGKESFDRLYRYKVARGIPMWEQLLDQLIDRAERDEVAELAAVKARELAEEVSR